MRSWNWRGAALGVAFTGWIGPIAAPVAAVGADGGDAAHERTLEIGGDVRFRGYSLSNFADFDHDDDRDRWSVFRLRTRVFLDAELEGGVRAFVRVANQNWGTGVTAAVGEDGDLWEADNKSGKLFVDAAHIDWTRAFGLPVELRLGRQSLLYGSGFVLFDGQSQLASTALYLDGVRARLAAGDAGTIDFLYFKDQENRRDDAADDDLTLAGAYFVHTNDVHDGSEEAYVLWREDQALVRRIVTAGARVRHHYAFGLDVDLEGALQRGDFAGEVEQEAWGVKTEAGWRWPGLPGAPRTFAGFAGLSGDDPSTGATDERWDVALGGWPQFGDLLAWVYLNLGPGKAGSPHDPDYAIGSSVVGEVVYSNLHLTTVGLELTPASAWSVRVSGARLVAPEPIDTSDDLGTYAQLTVRHRPTKNLALAVYGAWLEPGDAHGDGADPAHELFWETALSF